MQKTKESGFTKITFIMLLAVAGGMYLVKDEKGVSYLEKTYGAAKYYIIDRNEDALKQAKGAQNLMQGHQDELQKAIDE